MGKRLGLKGWVRNKKDKSVEAEMQGEIDKINYLIDYLNSLKRISISNIVEEDLEILKDLEEFHVKYEE